MYTLVVFTRSWNATSHDRHALLTKLMLAAAARDALGGTLELLPCGSDGLAFGSAADWPTPTPPRAQAAAADGGEWLGSFLRLGGAQLRRCAEAGAAAADREALLTLHCAAAGRAADDSSRHGSVRAAQRGAHELATLFAQMYQHCYIIVRGDNAEVRVHLLILVRAAMLTMEKCFNVIGLRYVDKM